MKNPIAPDLNLLAAAINTLPFKYYIVDKELNIVFWNRKGEQGPYGVKQEEATGKSLEAVLKIHRSLVTSPKPIPDMTVEFSEVFGSGKTISAEESSILKNGEKRHYRVTKTPLRDDEGRVEHVAVIIEDITSQRRLESMLIARERLTALEDLAAGIAHQVNNPLSTMMVCSESLLSEVRKGAVSAPETAQRFEHYLEMICKQISRCKQVSGLLVDFGGGAPGKRGRTDVNRLLEETVSLLRSSKRFSTAPVEMELSPGVRAVPASEPLLRQAFVSILINAFEALAGRAGGALRLSTFMTGDEAKEVGVAIKDNGCGIEREKMCRIFTPFFTAKGSEHAGLGLSVAHQIISEYGGRIEVESEAGKGSTFTVMLPT